MYVHIQFRDFQNFEHKKFLFIANVQPLRNALNKMILSRTDTEKWRGRVNKLYCYVTVIKKLLSVNNVEDWKIRMIWFTNFSNIFLQEHFRVTAVKPLKQLYYPLFLGISESK